MAKNNHANDDSTLYEHEWVAELQRLASKAADKDISVQYIFPAGSLLANGFRLQVCERKIQILLQRQSPSGSVDLLLQLSLPAQESAHYQKKTSEDGEVFLSVTYPYCDHMFLPNVPRAQIQIASKLEFLELVTSGALKQ